MKAKASSRRVLPICTPSLRGYPQWMSWARTPSAAGVFVVTFLLWILASGSSPVRAQGRAARSPQIKAVGSMNTARTYAASTTLGNGSVLITGGISANFNYLSVAELYNPVKRKFVRLPPMTTPRAMHTATLLPNGQVLIAGGMVCADGQCEELSSAEIYDPNLQQFFATGSMLTPRGRHTATTLGDGAVLVAGGYNGNVLSSAEIYDPSTGRFTETASMIDPRYLHTATLLSDGEVLIAGGRSCTGMCGNDSTTTAEVYDPGRRQFFPAGKLIHGRMLHRATLLQDGRVLLSGGHSCAGDCEGATTLADAEIYDPAAGKFLPAGSMSDSREAEQAVALPDGEVFVYGGASHSERDGWQSLNSGELFQPDSETFVPAGNGAASGPDLIGALLTSQQVLIAGGIVGASIVRTAEVFTFPAN